jgi:hypothetical protein
MIDNWRAPQSSNPSGRHNPPLIQLDSKPHVDREAMLK